MMGISYPAQAAAEEERIRELLCDVLSGWERLHSLAPNAPCADIFDELECQVDALTVQQVARHG